MERVGVGDRGGASRDRERPRGAPRLRVDATDRIPSLCDRVKLIFGSDEDEPDLDLRKRPNRPFILVLPTLSELRIVKSDRARRDSTVRGRDGVAGVVTAALMAANG